ncbi:MAG: PQQ-binding-like beta-propeller repeat protein, partial [Gemmataceae bacterium]
MAERIRVLEGGSVEVIADEKPANQNEQPPAKPKVKAAEEKAALVGAVTEDHLLKAADQNANWLMYGRSYDAHRFSPLKQINKKNVARLTPQWTFQTGVLDGFECTPLVIDGIMYLTTPWNHAYAIDCKTGAQLWHYEKSLPEDMALCCDAVNRGFAAWGERLYMTTLDAHLVCLDRNTGEEIWDTQITVTGDDGKEIKDIYQLAYSATVAPLVVKGKVILGISGAEYGIRGFLDAYDAKSGKRLWRFWTVPSPNEKAPRAKKALATWQGKSWLTGGGSAWVTGTYDPKLNT